MHQIVTYILPNAGRLQQGYSFGKGQSLVGQPSIHVASGEVGSLDGSGALPGLRSGHCHKDPNFNAGEMAGGVVLLDRLGGECQSSPGYWRVGGRPCQS